MINSVYLNIVNHDKKIERILPRNNVIEGVNWTLFCSNIFIAPSNLSRALIINKKCNHTPYGSSGSVIIGSN